jgi:outer membrane protein assembly factor BamE (lipoprotein component of BamABCDE complex)
MSPAQTPRKNAAVRLGVSLLILFAFVAFSCTGLLDLRPSIGDVEQAQTKIKPGMTKDEVRAVLGRPHRQGEYGQYGTEWDYWETMFVGSVLRVYFGPDGRVRGSQWWVH